MTVYKNIAFGLELRKTPKDEIDRRVHEAAKILEIEHLLDRKPKGSVRWSAPACRSGPCNGP